MDLSKAGIAVISLVVGFAGGALGGSILGGGAMAGLGAAAGISTGICTTIRAAQDLDFLTAEQVDAVLAKAAKDAGEGASEESQMATGSAKACDDFLDKSRS